MAGNDRLQPPFEAYDGREPYLFVSYSHQDGGVVYPEIERLHGIGFRIWYDEGIDPGNEWPDEVAKALDRCSFFVVFISPRSVASKNVKNEIHFAINHQKPFVAIHLEETQLPSGLELRISDIQAILRYRMPAGRYYRQVEKALLQTLRGEKALSLPVPPQAKPKFLPATKWSAVLQSARSDSSVSGTAQDALLRVYLPALQKYLRRVRRLSPDHVDDILQGFVADKILRGGLFRKADQARGCFRNLVLKSLNSYVATWLAKRAHDPLKDAAAEDLDDICVVAEQAAQFDENWARQTVTAALECMKAECLVKSRSDIWEVFDCRVLRPAYQHAPEVPYEELVAQFNLSSPREVINLLVTAKRMFVRCIREAIGNYAADVDVEGEMAALRGILMRSRNLDGATW